MKKTLAVILAILMMTSLLSTGAYADGETMNFSVTSATGSRGDEVTITVSITSCPTIVGMQVGISYDTNVLERVSFSNAGMSGLEVGTSATWLSANDTGSTYIGPMLTLVFRIKDTAAFGPSTVTINPKVSDLDENRVPCIVTPGTVTVTVAAHDHIWDAGTTTPATCIKNGQTVYKCTVVGCTETKTETIAATGHKWDNGTVTTAPTCTAKGVKTFKCTNSGCTATKTENVAATGHKWDNGTVTKAATYTETGIKTFTCKVCQATKTEDIPKVHTHDYTRLGEIIEGPYCETEGKRWMYCSYEGCNERVLMPVPAIGYHDWDTEHTECLKKATCTEKGTMLMHCKRDASHTMTYDYGGTGHIWDEGVITTPPTYEEYGEKTLHCKNCDATKTEKVLPTKYTFTVTVVPPTCTEDGYTMHKCNQDDSFSYKDNIVHSTGHHAAKRVIEPTCKEEGRTEIYCTVCGEVSSIIDTTPKTNNHTWDNGVVTTEPTAEKDGVKTYTCKVCNETKTETIPRLNSSGK